MTDKKTGEWVVQVRRHGGSVKFNFDSEQEAFGFCVGSLDEGAAFPVKVVAPGGKTVWEFNGEVPVTGRDNLSELRERAGLPPEED